MSERKKTNSKSVIDGPFSPQMENTSKTDAWKAMSAHARVIYTTSLRSRFRGNCDQNNNGKIHPSSRQIADETGFNQKTAARGLREIEHYGFTVETNPAHLGVDGKGKAAHLRLTELPCSGDAPTRDYLSWNGTLFDDGRKKNQPQKNKTLNRRAVHPEPPRGSPYEPPNGSYSTKNPTPSTPTPNCEQDQQSNGDSAPKNPEPPNGSYLDSFPSACSSEGSESVEPWQRNARTPDEQLPDDDIPPFLRRGHPDCFTVKE